MGVGSRCLASRRSLSLSLSFFSQVIIPAGPHIGNYVRDFNTGNIGLQRMQ